MKRRKIDDYFLRESKRVPISKTAAHEVFQVQGLFRHIFGFLDGEEQTSSRDIALCALLSKQWNHWINTVWPWKHVNVGRIHGGRILETLESRQITLSIAIFLRRHAQSMETVCVDRRDLRFATDWNAMGRGYPHGSVLWHIVYLAPPKLKCLRARGCEDLRVLESNAAMLALLEWKQMQCIDLRKSGGLMFQGQIEDLENVGWKSLVMPDGSFVADGVCVKCHCVKMTKECCIPGCDYAEIKCACPGKRKWKKGLQQCDYCYDFMCEAKCIQKYMHFEPCCDKWEDKTMCNDCARQLGLVACANCQPRFDTLFCRDTCTSACGFCNDRICDPCWKDWTETSAVRGGQGLDFQGGWCDACEKLVCVGWRRDCVQQHAAACRHQRR